MGYGRTDRVAEGFEDVHVASLPREGRIEGPFHDRFISYTGMLSLYISLWYSVLAIVSGKYALVFTFLSLYATNGIIFLWEAIRGPRRYPVEEDVPSRLTYTFFVWAIYLIAFRADQLVLIRACVALFHILNIWNRPDSHWIAGVGEQDGLEYWPEWVTEATIERWEKLEAEDLRQREREQKKAWFRRDGGRLKRKPCITKPPESKGLQRAESPDFSDEPDALYRDDSSDDFRDDSSEHAPEAHAQSRERGKPPSYISFLY